MQPGFEGGAHVSAMYCQAAQARCVHLYDCGRPQAAMRETKRVR